MPRLLLCLLLVLGLPGSPVAAAWRVAETAHFRVHGEAPAEALAAHARLLEEHRALLVRVTGRKGDAQAAPLDLYLLQNLSGAAPAVRIPPGVLGFYQASSGGIAVFASPPSDGLMAARTVLLHEVAHHFMLGDPDHSYPLWYIEGFADYFATARFRPDRIEFGHVEAGRLAWLMNPNWLPIETVLAGRLDLGNREQAARFYAQSWLMTHYLLRHDGGPDRLRAYLARTAAGEDPVSAFRAAVDPDLATFNDRLAAYLKDSRALTYTRVRRAAPPSPEVAVRALPASAEAVLLPMLAIRQGVDAGSGARLLAAIRATAGDAPADPLARRALALAELTHGDPARARDLLVGMTDLASDDQRLLGLAHRALGETGAARTALAAALAGAPGDWQAMVALATLDGLPADAQGIDLLIRGWQLAPQVPDNGLLLAHALGASGRLAEAAHVLMPLATSRHGAAPRAAAGALLELARAGDRETFLALFEGRPPLEAPPQAR